MESWKRLVNTALLGTGKNTEAAGLLSALPALAELQVILKEHSPDAEAELLKTAALLYTYRRCGTKPFSETIYTVAAEAEQKPYCSGETARVLTDILQTGSTGLLRFWLSYCDAQGSIVPPVFVDELLQLGKQHKALRPLIILCCGKRGEWLCRLNPEWAFHTEGSDAERWETGTLTERVTVLAAIRKTDPDAARALLQNVWNAEKADVKEALLKTIETNLSESDLPFLEGLVSDKSKRVQAAAYDLLMRIPGSSIVCVFEDILRQTVKLQTSRKLLGMRTKTSLEITYPEGLDKQLLEAIGKKPAGPGGMSEEEFQLLRMMSNVPPQFWEAHFSLPPQQILALFEAIPKGSIYMNALLDAAIRFRDKTWATLFKNETAVLRPGLLPLLEPAEQMEYLKASAIAAPESVIDYYSAQETEWDKALAPALMNFIAANPYQYNKNFFNTNAHLIPLNLLPALESFTPTVGTDMQDYARHYAAQAWQKTREHLHTLLTLKDQTLNTFLHQERQKLP